MPPRAVRALLIAAIVGVNAPAWSQDINASDEVQQGHRLANLICANCHFASADQPFEPILRPPAPSFVSIAQRSDVDANFIQSFLAKTHRDISNPNGMPNPQLMDYQVKQITAYLLSLRKQGAATPSATTCGREIARLEQLLAKARTDHAIRATAPESTAARLHRQPTPESVGRAEEKAMQEAEEALTSARKLDTAGNQTECLDATKKLAVRLNLH